MISGFREVGGYDYGYIKQNLLTNDRFGKRQKQFAECLQYMPKAWIDAVISKGKYTVSSISNVRSQCDTLFREIECVDELKTMFHETMHMFEHDYKPLLQAEQAYYAMRTDGCELERLGGNYEKNEFSRFDDFIDKYMGKDYGGTAYELMSCCVQNVLFNDTPLERDHSFENKDEGLSDWALGVLMLS